MSQALKLRTWEDGFDAGLQGNWVARPPSGDQELRALWQAAWTSGKKSSPLLRPPMDEHRHQTLLFRWAESASCVLPELALMYAVPNGGKRDPVTAAKLKQEGVKPGVPDVCLPVPRGGWAALYLEMKAPNGRLSPDQQHWLLELAAAGNRATPCYGWQQARELIREYLLET